MPKIKASPFFCYSDDTIFNHNFNINYNNPEKYIISGNQSKISDKEFVIIQKELKIKQINMSAIKKIYHWKHKSFNTESGGGKFIGKLTVNDLLKKRTLYGCHDHGLLLVSIFRKYKIPAVYVDATDIKSSFDYPEKTKSIIGHVFVEIYLHKRWFLFDSTSGKYIENYNPTNNLIPIKISNTSKGFIVMFKGLDPENYGITDIKLLINFQKRFSNILKNEKNEISLPNYAIKKL